MEIFVLLKPEELAELHEKSGNPIAHFGTHCVVAHPVDGENVDVRRLLYVNGRGFGEDVLALLRRRPEIIHVESTPNSLTVELRPDANVAPLVSLLVESGAEIEEVYRRDGRLNDLFRTLAEQHSASSNE